MAFASKTVGQAKPRYDAIVIGSGYGGGVAASRLARMGLSVALLERGRHWRPGDFPTTTKARRKTTRLAGRAPKIGDPTGLYYLSVGKGITVFGASGLGGGSLINAGVTLRPDFERLRKAGWPEPVVGDGRLLDGLRRAETMLGVGSVPEPTRFAKYAGMSKLAGAAGRPVETPPMTIAHEPGPNAAGVLQYACRYCGDCWSGCNVGAKITTGISYVADAVDHGAEVFCEACAQSIAKTTDGWHVEVDDLSRAGGRQRISAKIVVLAAGTMGTVELLLRARNRGLALSRKLGENFSANGDDLVFADHADTRVNAVALGFPTQGPRNAPTVGPHSMSLIDMRDETGPLWMHDGTMLTMMAALAPLKELLTFKLASMFRMLRQGVFGEDLSRSQVIYLVGHDAGDGRLTLSGDHIMVDWPGYSNDPARVRAEARVKAVIESSGAVFDTNPFAMKAFGGNRIIAHPLGGAGMGETVETGVVADDGRVFDPTQGPNGFHEGLYVCDGAAIPTSVGVSPLLTISGLAERAMMLLADRIQRPLDVTAAPARGLRDAAM